MPVTVRYAESETVKRRLKSGPADTNPVPGRNSAKAANPGTQNKEASRHDRGPSIPPAAQYQEYREPAEEHAYAQDRRRRTDMPPTRYADLVASNTGYVPGYASQPVPSARKESDPNYTTYNTRHGPGVPAGEQQPYHSDLQEARPSSPPYGRHPPPTDDDTRAAPARPRPRPQAPQPQPQPPTTETPGFRTITSTSGPQEDLYNRRYQSPR